MFVQPVVLLVLDYCCGVTNNYFSCNGYVLLFRRWDKDLEFFLNVYPYYCQRFYFFLQISIIERYIKIFLWQFYFYFVRLVKLKHLRCSAELLLDLIEHSIYIIKSAKFLMRLLKYRTSPIGYLFFNSTLNLLTFIFLEKGISDN